ncbi:MAG: hypothetical protein KBS56_05915 [Clostridiales bacterium]|nr:hypothetical protein [Candidatus Crickella equi]
MILYLDDYRRPPTGPEYASADNYSDFIMLLDKYNGNIEMVDLDYDLGYDSTWSGLDVLRYMKKFDVKCERINIHSTHPTGRSMMMQYATANFPDAVVTDREL